MGPSALFQSIYNLDTLDTRFTTSSSVPYQTVVDARSEASSIAESSNKAQTRVSQPPKWKSLEFYLYYTVIAIAVPYMFWIPYTVSRRRLEIESMAYGPGEVASTTWETQWLIKV